MEVEKKVCIAIGLCMIAYMLLMYKQMNEFKSNVQSENKKLQDNVMETIESFQQYEEEPEETTEETNEN